MAPVSVCSGSLEAGESSKAYKRSHNETINQILPHHTWSFTGRVGPQARSGSPSSTLPARPSSSPSPRKTPLAPASRPHPICLWALSGHEVGYIQIYGMLYLNYIFKETDLEAKQSWIYAVLLMSVVPVVPGGGIYSIIDEVVLLK